MHKCRYKNCNNQIQNKYQFCFEHRLTQYIDECRIHGKTKFILCQCQECAENKKPTYEVVKYGKYYLDKDSVKIDKSHFLYAYLDRITEKTRAKQIQHAKKITAGPGIYGIFVRGADNSLGRCLYIGQSYDVQNRVKQHIAAYKTAKKHIQVVKRKRKRNVLKSIKDYKVEYKYYRMAFEYDLAEIKFVKLVTIPKQCKDEQYFKDLLTYCEQAMIDAFKPNMNLFAARPSIGGANA